MRFNTFSTHTLAHSNHCAGPVSSRPRGTKSGISWSSWVNRGAGYAGQMPVVVLLRSWKLPWLVLLSRRQIVWGEGALAPIWGPHSRCEGALAPSEGLTRGVKRGEGALAPIYRGQCPLHPVTRWPARRNRPGYALEPDPRATAHDAGRPIVTGPGRASGPGAGGRRRWWPRRCSRRGGPAWRAGRRTRGDLRRASRSRCPGG